ncbi:MAG: pseudouridine synthase [Gammaproteobacteria bacterium]|nr:pseudouridine synthase [Gammaproteobacteria bacterium]
MAKLYLFNKPYQVLSQFTDPQGRSTLSEHLKDPQIRVAGRLDYDSEGLLLLTDNGQLLQQIANPRHKIWKTYWVQVEGEPQESILQDMRHGLKLQDGLTRPARVSLLAQAPELWPRVPPIRSRREQPTSWLEISIREGRNRQVRRMTAAVGHPTLRLVRARIGDWSLDELQPGEYRQLEVNMPKSAAVRRPNRQL